MSFPRYEAYKDSGVEWLGEVPEHWDVASLRWYATLQGGIAKGKEYGERETVRRSVGETKCNPRIMALKPWVSQTRPTLL